MEAKARQDVNEAHGSQGKAGCLTMTTLPRASVCGGEFKALATDTGPSERQK